MKESSFWSRRVRRLVTMSAACVSRPLDVERVENSVQVGTPDVDYCLGGYTAKIELKYRPHHPSRPGTPVLGLGRGMRKSQIVWATKRIRAGGTVFLCIGTCAMTWFIDLRGLTPKEMLDLEMASVQELHGRAVWRTGDTYEALGVVLGGVL